MVQEDNEWMVMNGVGEMCVEGGKRGRRGKDGGKRLLEQWAQAGTGGNTEVPSQPRQTDETRHHQTPCQTVRTMSTHANRTDTDIVQLLRTWYGMVFPSWRMMMVVVVVDVVPA